MKTVQFIIDPQKDFIISPNFQGALGVNGAYEDMLRIVKHIETTNPEGIVITLDTHEKMDIAHQLWWIDSEGKNPPPFTQISVKDISDGKWKASNPTQQEYSAFYVSELQKSNKYTLMIWPNHCIRETEGHKVNDELQIAINAWESKNNKKVMYVHKGTNPKTEHYSGLKAEVVLNDAEETKLNTELINYLNQYDKIEVSGEAISHCVGSTLIDLLENIPTKDRNKVTILTNCTSPVAGFEEQGNQFIEKAHILGANVEEIKLNKRPTI